MTRNHIKVRNNTSKQTFNAFLFRSQGNEVVLMSSKNISKFNSSIPSNFANADVKAEKRDTILQLKVR